MKKNKTLNTILGLSGLWLAILSLFMCFGGGVKFNPGYGDFSVDISVFSYMFNTGIAKTLFTELAKAEPTHRFILLAGSVAALLSIASIAILVVARLKGKSNKKLELGLGITAIILLAYFAISALLTRTIVMSDVPAEMHEEFKEMAKIGAGGICAGVFGILGAGSIIGSIITNPNK